MKRTAVLSPRGGAGELPDLASRGRLIAGQRIRWHRVRRALARRARWIATGAGLALLAVAAWQGRLALPLARWWAALLAVLVCIIVIRLSVPYVLQSWNYSEGSANPGGIPYRYVLKAFIPLGFFLFALQSVAEAIKIARVMALLPFVGTVERER